jgi:hypothetical protein
MVIFSPTVFAFFCSVLYLNRYTLTSVLSLGHAIPNIPKQHLYRPRAAMAYSRDSFSTAGLIPHILQIQAQARLASLG